MKRKTIDMTDIIADSFASVSYADTWNDFWTKNRKRNGYHSKAKGG